MTSEAWAQMPIAPIRATNLELSKVSEILRDGLHSANHEAAIRTITEAAKHILAASEQLLVCGEATLANIRAQEALKPQMSKDGGKDIPL